MSDAYEPEAEGSGDGVLFRGGSLLNLLEAAENAFGLPESEFLIVLQCVGKNHRGNEIV